MMCYLNGYIVGVGGVENLFAEPKPLKREQLQSLRCDLYYTEPASASEK